MEPEAGAASWHPALMPNSSNDDHEHIHHEEEAHDDTIGQSGSNNGAFLDQLNDHHDPEAAAWDLSSSNPEATAEVPTITEEPAPVANTSNHGSRMSFARTVSHDIDFIDDEDSDWNLQRTETDPFKFMPPTDRTNSFPVVPTMDAYTQEHLGDRPGATSQAQEIIQDLADEEEHEDSAVEAGASTSLGFEGTTHQHADSTFQPAIGGEVSGDDAAGSRFEEGLPLIAHNEEAGEAEESEEEEEQDEQNVAQQKAPVDFGSAFDDGNDGDEGDDFFSKAQGSPEQVKSPPTLQRKSTTVAIGGIAGSSQDDDDDDDDLPSPSEEGPAGDLGETGNEDKEKSGDLDAKWAAAFGDDDDDEFLAEPAAPGTKELDPADIFGSDDEGFLDDDDDVAAGAPTAPQVDTAPAQPVAQNGRYTPAAGAQPQRPANPYAPPSMTQQAPAQNLARGASTPAMSMFAPTPPRPEVAKAQSFADKAKGGYQSPYDLPMDVVKFPKKRASMQSMSRPSTSQSMAPPAGLPRSASGQAPATSMAPPLRPDSSQSFHGQPQGAAHKPPALRSSNSGFFEDLPMASPRSRPASRTNYRPGGQPSPQGPPQGPPVTSPLSATVPQTASQPPPAQRQPSGAPTLVAPERASPYAALSNTADSRPAAVPTANSRYSPAQANGLGVSNGGVVPPSAMSRYSPAPPASRAPSGAYGAVASGIPPPILAAHQPRTSSPLAHYEVNRELGRNRLPSPAHSDAGGAPLARTNSNQYEPRGNRIPSLPVTQEVEEENAASQIPPMPTNISPQLRYSNVEARRTPPPAGLQPSMLSPPKRATHNYAPQLAASPAKDGFIPPPRSQAGSPGMTRHGPRPSSGHSVTSPPFTQSPPVTRPNVRARGLSQHLNYVAPTDGRENDPLQRWRGSPVFTWGVGGTYVTSFPKDIPRYGIQSAVPQITRGPGEVKVKHSKDLQPLDESLSKFPGPLKGRSKKKEVVAWLTTAIEGLEQQQPNTGFQQYVTHENKRLEERLLLYRILRLFIEHDGVLEGNANVDKAVREVISPETTVEESSDLSTGADLGALSSSATTMTMHADAVDSSAIEQIRKLLLSGEREKAAWLAVDRRLWGHALLLANTVKTADLYRQVAQEFIKKEINHPGHGNESLAALYGVLSGNYEESVDELVPSYARAGMQLMSTSATGTASKDALAGLDKWRETLGLILSNRSMADVQALGSLGNLLSTYGRAEAAHICYLFARQHVVFSGLDDPKTQFVLIGADHKHQADQFAKETEALLLSEIFEYGLSLGGGSAASQTCSHLAAYKLQHALILAQYGFRDKALQYCDAIYNAISAQTKRSPYYNPGLESAVDDLMKRLKQAPKEESSSWITKPTSTGMWNRFNKFVAGDDNETAADGATGDPGTESGPFARIAGGTPTISRSPSVNNFEVYGSSPVANSVPSMPTVSTKTSSRYAPGAAQLSTSPYEPSASFAGASRSSGELSRNPYEPSRQSIDGGLANGNPYTPQTPNSTYQPASFGNQESPYAASQSREADVPAPNPYASYGGYEPYGAPTAQPVLQDEPMSQQSQAESPAENADSGYQPPSYGYQPPALNTFDSSADISNQGAAVSGYEAPSYQPSSFEAPSYEPGPAAGADEADDEQPKPKKKSFMDDDDDDFPTMKPQGKSKAEKDRENEELIRKVAEQEGKETTYSDRQFVLANSNIAQEAAEKAAGKKGGWGFGGWFGGAKKEGGGAETPKAIKAKLGEQSSFVYDPDLKRWVNKKAGAEETVAKTATPPPPRGTPPPPGAGMAAPPSSSSAPPMGPPRSTSTPSPAFGRSASSGSLAPPGSPGRPATLHASASEGAPVASGPPTLGAPPARPASRLSNASSIDDLLGAAGPRKGGKKPRKTGRYVDVMAK